MLSLNFWCVSFSLAAVQRPSPPADQPERGAVERGGDPGSVCADPQPEAVAPAGLVEGEPACWEVTVLGAGAAADCGSGGGAAAGEEEQSLGSCLHPAAQ